MNSKSAKPADHDISGQRRGEQCEFISPVSILLDIESGVKVIRPLADILAYSLRVCARNGWTGLYNDLSELAEREQARNAR